MIINNLESWTTREVLDQLRHNRNNIKVVEQENARIVEICESRIKEIADAMYKG